MSYLFMILCAVLALAVVILLLRGVKTVAIILAVLLVAALLFMFLTGRTGGSLFGDDSFIGGLIDGIVGLFEGLFGIESDTPAQALN